MGRKVAAFTDSDLSSYRRKDGWFFKIEIFERYIEKKVKGMRRELSRIGSVSYTHLTLPTIYSV